MTQCRGRDRPHARNRSISTTVSPEASQTFLPDPRSGGPALIEAKLRVPRNARGTVPRTRLLRRLRTAPERPLVNVVAPAGYGKSSFLAQSVPTGEAQPAWLTIDELDNDPVTFLTYLAAAIHRCRPLDIEIFGAIRSRAASSRAIVGRLLAALSDGAGPSMILIDDAQWLRDRESLDALAEFISYLPDSVRVAIASRDPLELPLERWRSADLVLDLGPRDLAMDDAEAAVMLRQLGLSLSADAIEHVTTHTQGWPALLALTALSIHERGDADTLGSPHERPTVADFLRSELLEVRTQGEVAFMTRTSILEHLNGPLCDAVLGQHGSVRMLASLARSTLLVDEYEGSYRYHPLLADFLRAELQAREPELVGEMHRRAAVWYEASGELDLAVDHAFLFGDLDFAASLVGKSFLRYHWSGRRHTVLNWLRRFDEDALRERPWLAVLGAWEQLAEGEVAGVEQLADIAERASRASFAARPPDGTVSVDSGRAMLRCAMAKGGADAMLRDATLAVELEASAGRWHGFALWLLAVARHVRGDTEGAAAALVDALAVARERSDEGLTYCILGHHALLAMDRQDWVAAAELLETARSFGVAGQFDGYLSAALARVATIKWSLHEGEYQPARLALARAAGLRPQLTVAAPSVSVLALLGFARLHLIIDDPAGARTLLTQAEAILDRRRDLGVLPAEVAALRATIAALPIGLAGASTLTAAELRVLAMLPYYLSFKEIGQRLGVKATTVKTHALSVYGKLGASSRGEAIDLAVEAGLLERFPMRSPVSAKPEDADGRR